MTKPANFPPVIWVVVVSFVPSTIKILILFTVVSNAYLKSAFSVTFALKLNALFGETSIGPCPELPSLIVTSPLLPYSDVYSISLESSFIKRSLVSSKSFGEVVAPALFNFAFTSEIWLDKIFILSIDSLDWEKAPDWAVSNLWE